MIDGYVTVNEIAEKWGVNPRTVQIMCNNGRIKGAVKFGRDWAVPNDVERPCDKRIVSGNYKGWRNKK